MNQIFPDWPLSQYLAAPGLSKHHLDYLRESPEVLRDYLTGAWRPKEAGPMIFGRLLHALVLEGREDFVTTPLVYWDEVEAKYFDWNPRKKVCRDWVKAQTKAVVDASEVDDMRLAATLVGEDKLAQDLLEPCAPERSMFAMDGELQLKSRPDATCEDGDYFVEFKTTNDASLDAFSREIFNRRYHVQAAMNCRIAKLLGVGEMDWYFIILQKGDRPRLNVRKLRAADIAIGQDEIDEGLALYRECERTGNWYGLSGPTGKIEEITMPEWVHQRHAGKGLDSLIIAGEKMFK